MRRSKILMAAVMLIVMGQGCFLLEFIRTGEDGTSPAETTAEAAQAIGAILTQTGIPPLSVAGVWLTTLGGVALWFLEKYRKAQALKLAGAHSSTIDDIKKGHPEIEAEINTAIKNAIETVKLKKLNQKVYDKMKSAKASVPKKAKKTKKA